MLYITNIDNCNFSLRGNTVKTGLKVLGKKGFAAKSNEPVYNEIQGRVTVYDLSRGIKLVESKPVSKINLDGTVHSTAQAFVVAFNNLMAQCTESPEPTTTTS